MSYQGDMGGDKCDGDFDRNESTRSDRYERETKER